MLRLIKKIKNPGISVKTSLISGVIVLVILACTSLFLLTVEQGLVTYIIDTHLDSIEDTIDKEQEIRRQSLENKISTNATIASEVLTLYLYELDQLWLLKALMPYMKIPEIEAVEVIDEFGEPFAAVWRDNGEKTGVMIPAAIKAALHESVTRQSNYDGVHVGDVRVYYTRKIYEAYFQQTKIAAEKESEQFLTEINRKITRTFNIQLAAVVLVIGVLIATISLYLRNAVIKPVLKCVEFAGKISGGIFSDRLGFVKKDEIGQLAFALDDMAENIRESQSGLTHALEEAKKASLLKSEFLANMSHELRTPLNSILLLSNLLHENRDNSLADPEVKMAGTINMSASELLDMINELLDLAKIEAGMMTVTSSRVYLGDISEYYMNSFEALAKEQQVSFSVSVAADLPDSIVTDAQRLKQILRNLISNAFKFTEQGSVSLEIKRPQDIAEVSGLTFIPETSVAFAVADTGIGIPPDQFGLIFESFRQVDGTISRKYGGTGLGLSISKEFSHLLDGGIHVASVEGRGSVFTLILPEVLAEKPELTDVHDVSGAAAPLSFCNQGFTRNKEDRLRNIVLGAGNHREGDEAGHAASPGKKNILLAGNIKPYEKELTARIRERGYSVIVSDRPEKTLFYANHYTPEMVLIDVNHPGPNGWQVLSRIISNPRTRKIPLFFGLPSSGATGASCVVTYRYCRCTRQENQGGRILVLRNGEQIHDGCLQKAISGTDETTDPLDAAKRLKTSDYDMVLLEKTATGINEMRFFSALDMNGHKRGVKVVVCFPDEHSLMETLPCPGWGENEPARDFYRGLWGFMHQVEQGREKVNENPAPPEPENRIFDNKKILIVDGDMRNLYTLSTLLENARADVVAAVNGVKGLARLREHTDTNLVVMDVMMADMDGYQAIREIRNDDLHGELPIIALSSSEVTEEYEKCIKAGATDYLTKPVDVDKFLSMVSVWL